MTLLGRTEPSLVATRPIRKTTRSVSGWMGCGLKEGEFVLLVAVGAGVGGVGLVGFCAHAVGTRRPKARANSANIRERRFMVVPRGERDTEKCRRAGSAKQASRLAREDFFRGLKRRAAAKGIRNFL